jgi:5-oxoprolinase (ATP-hydrolysing)
MVRKSFRFSIDRGGTFTDVYTEIKTLPETGDDLEHIVETKVLKLLSVDPSNYPDAPREGIRRIIEQETGIPHPRDVPLDTSRIESIRMGTTVRMRLIV